ncbi:MAG: ABC transporter ATP-binding protein [Armatimonadota bacterium]|nr:ABC transporter ATP-binding protein [Armatimonadota bacterium]MCX7777138.1 ABC transporter ATP-binding protein [Armatimonadota bacterium]MDW8025185.1 ABC transporter ATP-binding protein [Armatimonadota bacterium]
MSNTSAGEVVVELRNVRKEYPTGWGGTILALDDVSFEVYRGEIFGLVGPNGSGKTTTLKLILGLIFPTSGEIKVFDSSPFDISVKNKIGFLPDGPYFYDFLNADELLDFYGRLFGYSKSERKERIEQLLDLVGMKRFRKMPLRNYSKGMMQRIGLAQALINDPDLLLLDEPTTGIDPIGAHDIKQLMLKLREQGKTIFLCSHLLADVQMICDRVVILNLGRVIRKGTVKELLEPTAVTEIVAREVSEEVFKYVSELGATVERRDGDVVFRLLDHDRAPEVIETIRSHNGHVVSITRLTETLEDVFIKAVKEAGAPQIT